MTDSPVCGCIDAKDGWKITSRCLLHDPIAQMMRGEKQPEDFNFVGLQALIDND